MCAYARTHARSRYRGNRQKKNEGWVDKEDAREDRRVNKEVGEREGGKREKTDERWNEVYCFYFMIKQSIPFVMIVHEYVESVAVSSRLNEQQVSVQPSRSWRH